MSGEKALLEPARAYHRCVEAAFEWLFARQRFGVRPGLGRTRKLLRALDDPQQAFKVILVGGSNGKGSTAAALACMLRAAGRPAGLFTSPHLTRLTERFVIDGQEADREMLAQALERLRPHAEAAGATFFEVVTAVACLLFAQAGVKIAVMEVGLGGRLDATNALEPELAVITSIALEHTGVLGDTVSAIAREKAGIMRCGRTCLTGASGEALSVLQELARELGAELQALALASAWSTGSRDLALSRVVSHGLQGTELTLRTPAASLDLFTPLIGSHQARNVALSAAAARHLELPREAIVAGARRVRWPGRLEPLAYHGRTFLLDGAHNPEAARRLAETIAAIHLERAVLIFSVSGDKDATGMIESLAPLVRLVVLTRPRLGVRASDPAELARLWSRPALLAATPEQALKLAVAETELGETVIVAGSLYLIGEIRPLLTGEPLEPFERWQ